MRKSHLYFHNPFEGVVTLRQKSRFPGNTNNEDTDEIDVSIYTPHKDEFRRSRELFISELRVRRENRTAALNIPANVEYILLDFFNVFNSIDFENRYRRDFGIVPVKYFEYNTVGLFAISNQTLFESFLHDVNTFINSNNPDNDDTYNHNIRFIKSFKLLTTNRIIQYNRLTNYVRLSLVDNVELFTDKISPVESSLNEYLRQKNFEYNFDNFNNILEIVNIPEDELKIIIDNFDIIHTVNSPLSGHIAPSPYNTPVRTYGFTISNPDEELPIIGIIDSGISNNTPLSPLIINTNNDFDTTGTSPIIDNIDHGTGVAAFAALGSKLITNFSPSIEADAKLLSIKVIDSNNSPIMESKVISLIRKAYHDHGIKIFVLTLGYKDEIKTNSEVSDYARAFDNLAYELDIIIFISIGNLDISHLAENNGAGNLHEYPRQFESDRTCMCIPSESYNNISCGAEAENFESFDNTINLTPSRDYPACYSRKFHFDYQHLFFNQYRKNKQLVKPDLIFPAGDYNLDIGPENSGITVLSAHPEISFKKTAGTSYSAPLLANLAVKIHRTYPAFNMQTIKALMINSSNKPDFGFLFNNLNTPSEFLTGHGIPNELYSIYSDENNITMVLEDSITSGYIKSYPIRIPSYLLEVERQNALLEFHVTLCFKFLPVPNNQLAYCPLNISFGIFKNLPLESRNAANEDIGLNGNSSNNIKIKHSWSQDYYWHAKLLSNSQKSSFTVSKQNIIDDNNQFKLAIKSELHKLLPAYLEDNYSINQNFSLVMTINEKPIKGENTGMLYDEMVLINNLEAVTTAELEADLET
ncbi:MAG: S8 family serine peptidase [Ignavibacteriaceae bacterium]